MMQDLCCQLEALLLPGYFPQSCLTGSTDHHLPGSKPGGDPHSMLLTDRQQTIRAALVGFVVALVAVYCFP
ncbi:MAG TPA: hypothetical protein VF026_02865 [Ktedonobacteraceae bacterium]